ncbi:hypothetical protein QNO21_10085 [Microbacterium sp. zg-Y818]|uniref:hypothetical protein n=1 Tax=unclassified Microbacterium TaxID=2609290 RepID=UPI00214B4A3F|nr:MULTISPECIES: hypothetical protein [unclassified Microbacterium]MCR2799474.1 hypothetical protein [Microbacterium sp. zg.Y818]WIM21471.1 hypothetical protein QNO21_10085 [Microbacterium sp. zg-Y818]
MSINSTIPTGPQRKNTLVISAGIATGMIAVVGLSGCTSPGQGQDAAGVDLALTGESTLHEFDFPARNAFSGPRNIRGVPLPDPMAATPSAAVYDQRLEPYRLTTEEAMALSPLPTATAHDISPTHPHDRAVTTGALASHLAAVLWEVDAVAVNDSVDPLGYTVTVDVTTDGIAGVPLLVTWSLSGADVSAHWGASRLGARLQPTTDDGASVDIWIPNLRGDGDYTLDVDVVGASDGVAIAGASLLVEADASAE